VYSVQHCSMEAPFLVEKDGREVLIENRIEGLLGPDKWKGFFIDKPGESVDFGIDEVVPLVRKTSGVKGQVLRFLLAERWLSTIGGGRTSLSLRANIDFSAFQLRPLVKFFEEANKRLLIADETGLGKTIETGMIITEVLAERGRDACIVILCPKAIRWKWKREMRSKFGIRAEHSSFRDFRPGRVPKGIHIISQGASPSEDSMRVPNESIDLLVIDEVHNYIGRAGQQKRRGRTLDLSKASKAVVGLSATPIQIEEEDLRRILSLIAPTEHSSKNWGDEVQIQKAVNRTMLCLGDGTKPSEEDVRALAAVWPREAKHNIGSLHLPMTPQFRSEVQTIVRSLGPIGKRLTRARGRDPDVKNYRERKVTTVRVEPGPYRSIIADVIEHLQSNHHFSHVRQFVSCPSSGLGILKDLGDVSNSAEQLRMQLRNLMANSDPKIEQLLDILSSYRSNPDISKTVIFTHWRPTFRKLKNVLKAKGFPIFSVNPSGKPSESVQIVDDFREVSGFAVLLVTDAMSEGVDLEMANSMVNMDLPFNPAKLQQRIGRLDRYTQQSSHIEITNLVLGDSYEEEQVDKLESRLGAFAGMLGGYEAILHTDESTLNQSEIETINAESNQQADLRRLAESNVLLRVLDGAMDGKIREVQSDVHAAHSRLYMIYQAALEALGMETCFSEKENLLKVSSTEPMRRRLVHSNLFFADALGKGRAEFEAPSGEENTIILKPTGSEATFGPLDSFLFACENLLYHLEGFELAPQKDEPCRLTGGERQDKNRWAEKMDGISASISLSTIFEKLSTGEVEIAEWSLSENQRKCYGW